MSIKIESLLIEAGKEFDAAAPAVEVHQAITAAALATAVNGAILRYKNKGYIAAPIEVVVAPFPGFPDSLAMTAILSPKKKTPEAWTFQMSTNPQDWQRGKLFRNDPESQRGVVVYQGVTVYWGTTYNN